MLRFNILVCLMKNVAFFMPTDEIEVCNIIANLKNKKSVGLDKVTVACLKSLKYVLAPLLAYIINLCMSTGSYPDFLKHTIINPIFKKG